MSALDPNSGCLGTNCTSVDPDAPGALAGTRRVEDLRQHEPASRGRLPARLDGEGGRFRRDLLVAARRDDSARTGCSEFERRNHPAKHALLDRNQSSRHPCANVPRHDRRGDRRVPRFALGGWVGCGDYFDAHSRGPRRLRRTHRIRANCPVRTTVAIIRWIPVPVSPSEE